MDSVGPPSGVSDVWVRRHPFRAGARRSRSSSSMGARRGRVVGESGRDGEDEWKEGADAVVGGGGGVRWGKGGGGRWECRKRRG